MSFCIVQTRKTKKSLPSMTVVPANWVEDKWGFWPPNNLVSLSKNENSIPDKQMWKKQKCKLAGRAGTFELAEEMMALLEKVTDSEDAAQMGHGTRAKPAKKQPKFKSKSYKLASSTGTEFGPAEAGERATLPTTLPENTSSATVSESHSVYPRCPARNRLAPGDKTQLMMIVPPALPDSPLLKTQSTAQDQQLKTIANRKVVPESQAVGSDACQFSTPTGMPINTQFTSPAPMLCTVSSDGAQLQVAVPKPLPYASRPVMAAHHVPVDVVQSHHTSKASEFSPVTNAMQRVHNQSMKSTSSTSSMPHTVQTVHQLHVPRNENLVYGNTPAVASVYSLSSDSVEENSVSQQISLPVVTGTDGKQYAQLANGYYYVIDDNSNEITEEPLSIPIKQDEVDLGVDDCNMVGASSPACDEPDYSPTTIELRKINDRLNVFEGKLFDITTEIRKTNERLVVQEGLLVKLTDFMANFNKLMALRNKNDVPTIATRQEEDFSEFDKMTKIDSDESFKGFEQCLADPKFSEKFFRYLHSIYCLNGKRDSGPLFRTLMRKLLAPNVLIPYSWMENKRTKKGSTGDPGLNINFQATFPNFIKTMHQVLHAADCSTTREQNENLFKNLLRYKMLELKRYENGNGERRASSSRKRHKRQKTEDIAEVSVQTENCSNLDESSQMSRDVLQLPPAVQSHSSECGTEDETGSDDDRSSDSDD